MASAGLTASVINTGITADSLSHVCDRGSARLRGILFDGASGTIRGNTVHGVNQGASALIEHNLIAGNSWSGHEAAGSAVLLFLTQTGTIVRSNDIDGNADVGMIFVQADGALIDSNRVFETGIDGYYDVGIGNYGAGNVFVRNLVRGYARSSEDVADPGRLMLIAGR